MNPFAKPPQAINPAIDRRMLLRAGVFGLAAAPASVLAAQFDTKRGFTHGVASGEPGPDSVLLWARYRGVDAPATLRCEISRSMDFARIEDGSELEASPDRDWCAKTVVGGLAPGQWYFYRFVAPDGSVSPIGRTRTLPDGETARWRMAVFACSNLRFGWFNAYAHACEADDFDCTVHTGDYFYEYPQGQYPGESQAVDGRHIWPASETVALADYRLRYASYRADADLQRLHQLWPMISGWDDHESANDSWRGGAENHQPDSEGDWPVRKAAAMRAYREWMPVSDDPWASYRIGDLATLFRVESRLLGRDEPPSLGAALRGATSPEQAVAALQAFKDGVWRDPTRSMFGAEQEAWLATGLAASRRDGTRWQVLAQQTVMGNLVMPDGIVEGMTADTPDFIRRRIASLASTSAVDIPFNMDAWGGYPAARQRLLDAARAADADLVVLSGDSHNAWACELDGAGVEFAGQSVTSPGAESSLPWVPDDRLARLVADRNPELVWADTSRRGYMAVELTHRSASCEYRFMDTIRQRSTALAGTHRMEALAGTRRFAA